MSCAGRTPVAWLAPAGTCVAGFVLGVVFCFEAGYYWFEWANHYIIFILTLVGCAECIGLTWIRCVQTTLTETSCTDQASLTKRWLSTGSRSSARTRCPRTSKT